MARLITTSVSASSKNEEVTVTIQFNKVPNDRYGEFIDVAKDVFKLVLNVITPDFEHQI